MQIELQYQTPGCAGGDCPARYKVTEAGGGYVIQGKILDPETRARLRGLGTDEDAVWVPADVIEQGLLT